MQANNNHIQTPSIPQRLGLTSLILGIVTGLINCLYPLLPIMIATGGGDFGAMLALLCINSVQCLIALLNITGLILGVTALRRKETQKGKAIGGLVLNFLVFCISTCLLWYSVPMLVTVMK